MTPELKNAEMSALKAMAASPLEIWTETLEGACAIMVCHGLAKRGLCNHERANATLARFTITDSGRLALKQ